MGLGNLLLMLTALWIYKSAGWSVADLAIGAVVLLMIAARYFDIVRYQGTTADADAPATIAHLKRYSLVLVLVATAVWALARALGPGFTARG